MKGDCNFVLYSLDRDVHIKKVHTLVQSIKGGWGLLNSNLEKINSIHLNI